MKKICEACKKEFEAKDKRNKCCSWICRNIAMSKKYLGKVFTEEHKKNISKNHHNVSGKNNPRWIGGIRKDGHGYYWSYAPNHKYAVQNYVKLHRLIMEEHLGRILEPDEIVHHINQDKSDNRIENLQVLSVSEHMKLHGILRRKAKNAKTT